MTAPSLWVSCGSCRLLTAIGPETPGGRAYCPRCGEALSQRKPNSLSRTWALLIAAAVLYVPANLFPVMTIISFGASQPATILTGVKELAAAGMWPIAVLVFVASITIPMLKLVSLSFLLISVQLRSQWRPRDRTRLYHMIEGIGRWSMIDVFMISILVALIQLAQIATVEPGVGAVCFATVVILTMLATSAFDPRLIWDCLESDDD
ncbi:MAG: paraquat-inducible protein A [Pseudomonadota bacterium]